MGPVTLPIHVDRRSLLLVLLVYSGPRTRAARAEADATYAALSLESSLYAVLIAIAIEPCSHEEQTTTVAPYPTAPPAPYPVDGGHPLFIA